MMVAILYSAIRETTEEFSPPRRTASFADFRSRAAFYVFTPEQSSTCLCTRGLAES